MAANNIEQDPIVQKLLSSPRAISPKDHGLEKEWRDRASKLTAPNLKEIEGSLAELDSHLTLRSYIGEHKLTKADLVVWGVLRSNRVAHSYIKQGLRVNLARWFNFVEESSPWIGEAVADVSAAKKPSADGAAPKADTDGGSYDIGLQDTSKGVVTRFPPEPSGYLHIGHAKAALLNDYFAHKKYKGTLILRFDDTNPLKEKQEFEDSIVYDLELLGIKPDKVTHTSDYFQELYDYCIKIIKLGKAYADDSDKETIKADRDNFRASKHREDSVEDSLKRFEEMTKGTEEGVRWSIRAKISYDDVNGAMRDPVIYRCSPQAHHRTGDRWKVYPTYDFCCPVIDAHEGVTHALRTTEYNDRDAQYQWFLKALDLRHVYNWNFSRMNFVRTLLSKRKLTKFVDEGVVWGWDDPRMPTVRGVRRRGMTVEALHEYILKQGPSKNIVNLDWTSFWATNKKYIDPLAARYTAIASNNAVSCTVAGARANPFSEDKELHAKYALGTKKVFYSGNILLEQEDAASLEQDEEITLMNWGNAIVRNIHHSLLGLSKTVSGVDLELHLQGDVKKTKKKLTWLSKDQELIPVELVDFDYLITKDSLEKDDKVEDFMTEKTEFRTKALADCNVANLKENDVMQFDRKGYFRVDKPFLHGEAAVLFQIPTGKTK